ERLSRRGADGPHAAALVDGPRCLDQVLRAVRALGSGVHRLRRVRSVRHPARGLVAVHGGVVRGDWRHQPLPGIRLCRLDHRRRTGQHLRLLDRARYRATAVSAPHRVHGVVVQAVLRGQDARVLQQVRQPRPDPGPVRADRPHLRHPGRRCRPDGLPALHHLHRRRRSALGLRSHHPRLLPRPHPLRPRQHRSRSHPDRDRLRNPDGRGVPAGPPPRQVGCL
ncbi:MAG: DedA protein, partial [uncultured Propionibacteriaceae bacterium]